MKTVFLYGIGGAKDQFRVIRWTRVDEPDISITTFKNEAWAMRIRYPNVQRVFAIDDRGGLYQEYRTSIKKNSIESCMIFRDILERQGVEIV